MRFNPIEYSSAISAFKDFYNRYSDYETTRTESTLPRIFSLALKDIGRVEKLILREKGFRPSSVLRAFYALGEEWGEIFKVSESEIATHGFKKVSQKFCSILIDFPLEYCQKILNRIGIDNAVEILDKNYVTHPVLLVQCLQELAYKFITTSKKALARYTQNQHKKLVRKVITVLKEEGFIDIRPDVKMKEAQNRVIAQFDVIAVEKSHLLHLECKTKRTPWRMRMFPNPLEMRKEGLDFIKDNKLSSANWNRKLKHLNEYADRVLGENEYQLVSLVVTDTPTPASITCKHIDIIWINNLKDHIRKILKR